MIIITKAEIKKIRTIFYNETKTGHVISSDIKKNIKILVFILYFIFVIRAIRIYGSSILFNITYPGLGTILLLIFFSASILAFFLFYLYVFILSNFFYKIILFRILQKLLKTKNNTVLISTTWMGIRKKPQYIYSLENKKYDWTHISQVNNFYFYYRKQNSLKPSLIFKIVIIDVQKEAEVELSKKIISSMHQNSIAYDVINK
ncbi:hypothetical protein CMALT430_80015 [Carnobacterium maltaromaticum]|uniref:hypothetical protein n=1 Tax=Carnobacterium maltaromaticum TaxID=2751 RepID=UPI00191BC3DD|nr:hypothetical protein [Carnobacterium maltaromaticum]CAD5902063.1 hypothetical protein CMALT430_80015 [Carnobacterium maltaromaticum]